MGSKCSGCGADLSRGKFCPKCGIENSPINNAMQDGTRALLVITLLVIGVFLLMGIISIFDNLH